MKIIGICGSPRGRESQTMRLVKAALDGAESQGAETELVDLCDLRFSFCGACDACHATGRCAHQDKANELIDNLLKVDGIVLGSPNYFRSVSGPMKAFIDRMSRVIHCQFFAGKYGCSAATAGGQGAEGVADYLNELLVSLGAYAVGRVTASIAEGQKAMHKALEEAGALGKDLFAAISSRREYEEQKVLHERTAAYFRRLVESNRDLWPYEHEVWNRKNF